MKLIKRGLDEYFDPGLREGLHLHCEEVEYDVVRGRDVRPRRSSSGLGCGTGSVEIARHG